MTDNITLRRAVVEQVREALVVAWQSTPVWQIAEARNALVAALAEPDAICSAKDNEAALERVANRVKPGQVKGLLPEPDAKRKPATMKQIITAHGTTIGAPWFEDFARAWKAAERFHGIRKEDKT
jgi:hypothetical protein